MFVVEICVGQEFYIVGPPYYDEGFANAFAVWMRRHFTGEVRVSLDPGTRKLIREWEENENEGFF